MPKVLVANRGEIAIRIFKTARKKGWACVAVYSDADRDSLHLEYADEAYYIGSSPATESYLNIPAILKAAKDSNAGYIHPGYGFLSEKAEFAQAVADMAHGISLLFDPGREVGPKQLGVNAAAVDVGHVVVRDGQRDRAFDCLLYTSPRPRDSTRYRMTPSA